MNKIVIRQIVDNHSNNFAWSVELPDGGDIWFAQTWSGAIEQADELIRLQKDNQWSLGNDNCGPPM